MVMFWKLVVIGTWKLVGIGAWRVPGGQHSNESYLQKTRNINNN